MGASLERRLIDHHHYCTQTIAALHLPVLAAGGNHGLCDALGVPPSFPPWMLTSAIPTFGVFSGLCVSLEPSPQSQGRVLLGTCVAVAGGVWATIVYGCGYAVGYTYGCWR